MSLALTYTDAITPNTLAGENMRAAGVAGVLTDANVAAANTVDGIRAIFNSAQGDPLLHSDIIASCPRWLEAFNAGVADGVFNDSDIAGLTTVAGLVNLTFAADNTLSNQWE
jgi:hypothetical protein